MCVLCVVVFVCVVCVYIHIETTTYSKNKKLSGKTSQLEKVTGANGRQWGMVR